MKFKKNIILLLLFAIISTSLTGCFKKTYTITEVLKTNLSLYEDFKNNCILISDVYSSYLASTMSDEEFKKNIEVFKEANELIKKEYKKDIKNKKLAKYDRNQTFFNIILQLEYEFDKVSDLLSKSIENDTIKDRVLLYDIYSTNMESVKLIIYDYELYYKDYIQLGLERKNIDSILSN